MNYNQRKPLKSNERIHETVKRRLDRRAELAGEPVESLKILIDLGGEPMTVSEAEQWCRESGMSLWEYLGMLDIKPTDRPDFIKTIVTRDVTEHERSVRS